MSLHDDLMAKLDAIYGKPEQVKPQKDKPNAPIQDETRRTSTSGR